MTQRPDDSIPSDQPAARASSPSTRIEVAVAGEALIDLIRRPDGAYLPCLGGALYNLSRALSRQGVGVHYLNPLSADRFGQSLREQLVADGVRLSGSSGVQAVTSLAVVNLNERGHPDYAFYREGVADRAIDADALIAACQGHEHLQVVCTGALALDARDTALYLPWLAAQRSAGRTVVVDANLRPSVMPDLDAYRKAIHQALAHAHVIKVSDEDLDHLQVPGPDALSRARQLLDRHADALLIALTLGAEGAWLLHRDGRQWFERERRTLRVVDTVGAGDSFLAGLLAHLLDGWRIDAGSPFCAYLATAVDASLIQALRHAIASASLNVQEQGCVPPSWERARAWAAAPVAQGGG